MKKHLIAVAAALTLGGLAASTTASANEIRLFATATFGDSKFGFADAAYGWASGNNIFSLGASMQVSGAGDDSEFNFGVNGGYTYLFNPEGSTGFVEGRVGTFDISEFSDSAFYEASVGYRWYVSDRASVGWNMIGWEQRKFASIDGSDWDGNAFTRLQLIIALD